VRVQDLSGNPRVRVISELLIEASRARQPTDVFRVFGPRMWKIRPIEYFISVSIRGLTEGRYKITRRYDVREMQQAEERADGTLPPGVTLNPWKSFAELPAHQGGFIGSAIAGGTPKIITGIHLTDDPVFGSELSEFRSAIAIPLLDNGRPLNCSGAHPTRTTSSRSKTPCSSPTSSAR
jgi:sigma-B regulation protein RsbU (phosphoserine phosphatase)